MTGKKAFAAAPTLSAARSSDSAAHTCEALGLWIDRPEDAVIEEAIRLPADLRTAIQRSRRTRERAEREQENA
jgi:hypothetical protein